MCSSDLDEADLDLLEVKIREVKEGARILRTTRAQIPLPMILSVGLFESDQYFNPSQEEPAAHADHDHSDCDHDHGHCHHDHDHHHHHHSDHLAVDGFTSLSFASDRPFAIRQFQHFLDNQLPQSVFRAKGILWFAESPRRHVFHLSGKRFSLDDEDWKGSPKNQIVLIGQDLDHQTLREQLQHCLATAADQA